MADDLGPAIRAERLALIELLEQLEAGQWSTPSLCRGWTVQDVAAHLAWAPAAPVREVLAGMARAGFRPNRASADIARGWSRRGTAAILDQLRANAADDAKPVGTPRVFAVVDAVVHGLDIRRPLGVHRRIPAEAFRPAADQCARTRWPSSAMLGGSVRQRIDGLRLVAEDVDWSHGSGPEVRGPTDAMMLVLAGRPVRADDLSGPGAGTLYARLAREHRTPATGYPDPPAV
jgi:uncharacterized protein (TIGR03083 family)